MSQIERNQSNSPFISGVMLGGVLGSMGLYFFGTARGRAKMRQILDACEHVEEIVEEHEKHHHESKKNSLETTVVSDVENLMSKLKSILPENKSLK